MKPNEVRSQMREGRGGGRSSGIAPRITHHVHPPQCYGGRVHPPQCYGGRASRITPPASRFTAFTLIELLVVLAIIALLAALAMPVLRNFKPNYAASATRQLLDDLARARQLAISQRTTVYMIFVPTNFWQDLAFAQNTAWFTAQPGRLTNLLEKQTLAYAFVSLHSMGDQPGRPTARYLSGWRTLPEGAFIYPGKFQPNNYPPIQLYTNDLSGNRVAVPFRIVGFSQTYTIPFPNEDVLSPPYVQRPNTPFVKVPYLAFDYMGQLASGDPQYPELIPLVKGNLIFPRGPDRKALEAVPSYNEQPPGNAVDPVSFNWIYIDRITGRARAIQREVR